MLKKINYLPFAITWFIILTVLLCLPGSVIPQENWLDKIYFDKIVHIGLFGGLVFLWCGVERKRKKKLKSMQQNFVWIALGGCVYGIAMEFVQKYFIPNRSFDTGDMIADAIGSIIALVVATKLLAKK
ncbi:MAG: VanZ family protein [Chitinophagaceae bacterium]